MENLLKEKDKLKQKISTINDDKNTKIQVINSLTEKISTLEQKLQDEQLKIENLEVNIKQRQFLIKDLETEVFKHEIKIKEQVKQTLQEEYKYYIEKVNRINFDQEQRYEKNFNMLTKILIRSKKFYHLFNKLKLLYKEKKDALIFSLKEKYQRYENDVKKIQAFSQHMYFFVNVENYFEEYYFIDVVFDKIMSGFSYNFLSSRKTNRLDKPEWFVEFLIDKIRKEKRNILIYSGLKRDVRFFKLFFERIQEIIKKKLDEIKSSQSEQKIKLVIHFAGEVSKLKNECKKMFGYEMELQCVKEVLLVEETGSIKTELKNIHLGDYEKWFVGYQKMINNIINTFKALQDFDENICTEILQIAINEIELFYRLLSKRMNFLSKEETYLICFVFSGLEQLKIYITEKQEELISNNDISINVDLHPLSGLNSELVKLLKEAAKDDLEYHLKRIKNIKFIQEKVLVNTRIEITNLLNNFKKRLEHGYNILDKFVGEYLDNYFFENIILRVRFDKEDFERFTEFYKQIKNCLDFNNWKTDLGCKCVNDILNGKEPKERRIDSLFSLVYRVYENDQYY